MDENEALKIATMCAQGSPCKKSRRGVVLWRRDFNSYIYKGCNHPPRPFVCNGSQECADACSKICIHAEQDAIMDAVRNLDNLRYFQLLHVKVNAEGNPVPSGPPSCWQCSKLILISGIERVWLLHEDGLKAYTPELFHEYTLRENDLPRTRIR